MKFGKKKPLHGALRKPMT